MGVLKKRTDRDSVYAKFNGKCAYCGHDIPNEPGGWAIDHIEPLKRHVVGSKAHLNVMSNYNPCCKSCNSSKGSMNIEKWRSEIVLKVGRLHRDSSQFRLLSRLNMISCTTDFKFHFEKEGA